MPPLSLPRPVFSVNHHPKSHNIGQAAASCGPLRDVDNSDVGNHGAPQRQAAEFDSAKSSGYFFLTGASGLVGRYLTRDLLASGKRLAVLARSNRRMSAHDRIELLLQRWEQKLGYSLPRPIVLEGDVSQPNLGLSTDDQRWISRHCTGLIHNAAVVKFEPAEQDQEPWRTNLYGTRHALDLARRTGLRELHYVSTAYVCGNRSGVVREDELDCGQGFRNSYEESKFLAEREVMDRGGFSSKTVYRPSIIAGDSQTGYTSSYHGLMWYLRLLAMLVPQQPRDANGRIQTDIELPVSGDEPHNVITVDWVSRAICRLVENPESRGRTFHLVSEAPTTFRAVIDWCCEFFNSTGVRFVERSLGRRATSQFAEMFFSSSRVYQDYDACLVNFDNRNFKALVPDFPCPVISREQVIRYLEFGAQDAWGKRREQNPVSLGTPKELAERFATTWIEMMRAEGSLASEAVYSLDIRGISGGQWHFTPDARPDQAVIHSGLCDLVAGHLVIDTNELLVAVGLSEATPAQQLQEAISRLPIEDFILRQRGHMSQRLAGQPQLNAGAVIHSHR
jgi:thioester reductase-like protein